MSYNYSTGYIWTCFLRKTIAKAILDNKIHLYLLTLFSPINSNENRYQEVSEIIIP